MLEALGVHPSPPTPFHLETAENRMEYRNYTWDESIPIRSSEKKMPRRMVLKERHTILTALQADKVISILTERSSEKKCQGVWY